ncbi:MAG: hypothetical protein E7H60_19250 [Pseudomonas oryzihabitans]|uniref:hypothetical protein n=1 Tax=Pseudomonas oryzihabitans TaxID=47885 RepID=UPI0029131976|nr:hypothetical protein [Pseudomonas oryzihabitans]MDU4058680.1 hypothetical protein [Pseudomonas oryzihabitans]
MNDEQFQEDTEALRRGGYVSFVDDIRARDTAQREALARVEASAATMAAAGRGAWAKATTLQTQLAEAVGLLGQLHDITFNSVEIPEKLNNSVLEFLACHDQAEQQEAQGAQAGEFQREDRYIVIKRKDLEAIERSGEASDLETHEAVRFLAEALDTLRPHLPVRECLVIESDWPEYEPTWAAIQARAALATQPAAGEPVAWRFQTCSGGRWHVTTNKMHARIFEGTEDGGQVQGLFAVAPSAAAHGDEAVRKDAEAAYIEMTCQPVLIDGAHHYYLSSERMQAFDRLFSVDVSDAAMRAQGDGEVQ